MNCVNIETLAAGRYRLGWEEAYYPDHIPYDNRDPWMRTVICKRGIIYPYGPDLLAAEVDYHLPTFRELTKLPGAKVHQSGDYEKTVLFPPELFDQVCEQMIPYRRRILTEEQKQRLRDIGESNRFAADTAYRSAPASAKASGDVEVTQDPSA